MANQTVFPHAFFEGKIVPVEKAQISIMTNALQYGTGYFAGVRGYWNEKEKYLNIFRLKDHMKRFVSSAKILGVSLKYSESELEAMMVKLTKENKPQCNTYYRPFSYASSHYVSPDLSQDGIFETAVFMIPLNDYLPTNKGLKICVSTWRRIPDNVIPARAKVTGSYINSALAKQEATARGCDDAILLDERGHVTEGSAMNFFMVRDGVLITSAISDDILEGITRRTILQMANDLGIPTQERSVDRTELYIADEVFFSGTGVQVAWVAEIDNRQIGSGKRGEITGKIQDLFFRIVRGEEKKYESWNTKLSF